MSIDGYLQTSIKVFSDAEQTPLWLVVLPFPSSITQVNEKINYIKFANTYDYSNLFDTEYNKIGSDVGTWNNFVLYCPMTQ